MEKIIKPVNGWLMLIITPLLFLAAVFFFLYLYNLTGTIICLIAGVLILGGYMAIEPNEGRVCTLFGAYKGTVKESGFGWINPFYSKRSITLRAQNLETSQIKVNDKPGNPIVIGAIVVWKVEDTYKASFDVNGYGSFVNTQSEAALRKIASEYAYDNIEDEHATVTLRSSSQEINDILVHEISERLKIAGIHVVEARISHLAYAPEIAGAMLQRQQASAIVSARSKIVEGAVGMVEMALKELSSKDIIELDEEKKATMVSNLLVVLCGERAASPVINTGTLIQ